MSRTSATRTTSTSCLPSATTPEVLHLAKRIIYKALGEDSEDYPENPDEAAWGDIPLYYNKSQSSGMGFDLGQLTMSLQKQIEKAAGNHDDAVVAVMKEVKSLLKQMDKEAS